MNKKKLNRKLIIINAILLYLLINRFVIMPKALILSEGITSSFCIVLMVLAINFFGYPKIITNENTKKFFKLTIITIFLYFLGIYSAGLAVGFLTNSYSLAPLSILNNIYNVLFFAIAIEIFRYVFINAKENYNQKGYIYVITFLITLLESNLYMGDYAFSSISSAFKFVTIIFIPILVKNVMCSYLTSKTDFRVSLLYRFILDLYIFIVPVEPDLNDFFLSITTIILPYVILVYATRISEEKEVMEIESYISEDKKLIKLSDIPYMILMGLFACVILGFGPLKLIGIETGSMTPAIRIGDAVLVNKICDRDSLKEGDIVAYENEEHIIVVHRIYKINKDETFITKGDYNNSADSKYVTKEQIKGKVMFKIPFIAYPTIYFKK
jgi:signal peptidase